MSHDPYVLAAIAALFAFAVYRRFRRLFARQALQPTRLKVRVVVLAIVAALFAFSGLHSPNFGAALLGGVALGAVLAWFGVRLTRFEVTPAEIFARYGFAFLDLSDPTFAANSGTPFGGAPRRAWGTAR